MSKFDITPKNKVVRVANRARYDKAVVYDILDKGFLCHVAFNIDGQPFIIPTTYGRKGEKILVHGSVKSRMIKTIQKGIPVCLSVTHVDGLVLARSAFHHSANYRSVVVYGTATQIEDIKDKEKALFVISENILKDRREESRKPTRKELDVTAVLEIEIESASAKIREGGPVDDKEDYDLNIWAGILPIQTSYGQPITDPQSRVDCPISPSVRLAWETSI